MSVVLQKGKKKRRSPGQYIRGFFTGQQLTLQLMMVPAMAALIIFHYQEYGYVEDHFARLNTALTRGRALCRVGVIHPVESCWLHFGPKKSQENVLLQIDENFQNLTAWLLRGMIDFDFISESLLPSLCSEDQIGKTLPAGDMAYDTILIPPVETLRQMTVARLWKLAEGGGRVVFLGNPPAYMDAVRSDAPKALYAISEHCPFEWAAILSSLSAERQVEVLDENDMQTHDLFYQMRQEEEKRWLFICHADPCVNPDIPVCRKLRFRVRGHWKFTLFDTVSGRITPVDAGYDQGWTEYQTAFYDHDSLLLRLEPSCTALGGSSLKEPAGTALVSRFLEKMEYTLDEPNVLLLDRAEYALNDSPWQPAEDILRLDQNLRDFLGWPRRGGGSAQPWTESIHSFPHVLHLRYRFESEIAVEGAELALENAPNCTVRLNHVPSGPMNGWYTDHCIGKIALPAIRAGENILEVSMPYGRRTNPEAMYLLGNVGVSVQGVFCTITKQPEKITFGDLTRQGFPFYGGSVTYRMRSELEPGRYILQISQFRAALLRVSVDGTEQGVIAFSPYKLSFDIAEPGEHTIAVKAFGCRINTFGQLHHIQKKGVWWGPGSWRTKEENWSYEYHFWEQGILKSPELFSVLAKNE